MMAHKEVKAKQQASTSGWDAVGNVRGWGGHRKKRGVLLPTVPGCCLSSCPSCRQWWALLRLLSPFSLFPQAKWLLKGLNQCRGRGEGMKRRMGRPMKSHLV